MNWVDLTQCGQVKPTQHCLKWCPVAWWHQTITWTSADLSLNVFRSIHLRTISQEILKISALDINFKITNLKLQMYLPGTDVRPDGRTSLELLNPLGTNIFEKGKFIFYHWLGLSRICNYIHHLTCDEITYPFPNFNGVPWKFANG